MPKCRHTIAAFTTLAMAAISPVFAQPTIDTISVNLLTESNSDVNTNGEVTVTGDQKTASSSGFTQLTAGSGISGPFGEFGSSAAAHQLNITGYSIRGTFAANAEAIGVTDSESILGSRAVNEGEIQFTLAEDARLQLVYFTSSDTTGSDFFSGGSGLGRFVVEYTNQDGAPAIVSRLNLSPSEGGYEEISGTPVIEVQGGTNVTLTYEMSAFAGVVFPVTHSAETILAFQVFVVDETDIPVDADDDGIPDEWEENGIDVDGDGTIDIDLPAIASNAGGEIIAGRKTLFVELDAHAGVAVDAQAIADVVQAFADAPVLNQDGSTGIDLIVVIDDDSLPNEEYDGTGWPPEFDAAKADFFGPADLRTLPNWETDLKPEYAKVFRYGIWGQAMFRLEDDGMGGENKVYFTGKGELPGNDFYVAAGRIIDVSYASRPELVTDALAGTFMHELGHNLDLRHGGHENKNYKPNYLSVMNYAYQLPFRNSSAQGTDLSDAWFLDYARSDESTLNETELREDQGFDGPPDRAMIFNVAAGDDPRSLLFVDADAPEIDWDFSQTPIQSEPVTVNLTRFRLDQDTDGLDTALVALSDWDRIWYRVGGAPDFADGVHDSVNDFQEISEVEIELIQTLVINDLTTPDGCPADVNADGVLDLGDIQAFVDLFLASDLAADFNPDGVLDTGDITAFVAAFLEGC